MSQDSEQYVEKLLELFNRFSLLVNQAFTDDPRFLTSRDMVSVYYMFLRIFFYFAVLGELCVMTFEWVELVFGIMIVFGWGQSMLRGVRSSPK